MIITYKFSAYEAKHYTYSAKRKIFCKIAAQKLNFENNSDIRSSVSRAILA
jgi:hypothetical protein